VADQVNALDLGMREHMTRQALEQAALTRCEGGRLEAAERNDEHGLLKPGLELRTQGGADAIGEVAKVTGPLEAEKARQEKHDVGTRHGPAVY
jgi:hypothetical protein